MNGKTPPAADGAKAVRKLASTDSAERDAQGFTPEMREIADKLVHPEGDPYENARRLGFYCEQCG